MMVKITGYKEVAKEDGSSFVLLELTGGLEMVQSSNSGKFYATVRSCKMPSTFNADTAKSMVGQQFPGDIVRVSCESYEFVSTTTGEVMTLQHTYAYQPPGSIQLIGKESVNEPVTA